MPEIKLCNERFDITETVAMKYGHSVLDDSIIVPDVKPDIKRVLDVNAASYITDVTPGQDKVHAEGVFRAVILYLPDGEPTGRVKALSFKREFSCTIESKGVTADNKVTAESEIDSVDTTLINSRKLNLRVNINVGVKICRTCAVELPVDTEAPERPPVLPPELVLPEAGTAPHIEIKRTPLRFADKQFSSDGSIILRGQHEISGKLPQIGEVLLGTVLPEPESAVVSGGKIRLSGSARVYVLYEEAGENAALRTAEFSIPYAEEFEASGLEDDMECEAEYRVRELYTEALDNTDGERRIIGAEAVLGAAMSGYAVSEPKVITDAYCTGDSVLTPEFKEVTPEQLIDCMTAQITLKCSLRRRPTDADISGICSAAAENTTVSDVSINDGRVCVKGGITVKLLCTTHDENQPIYPVEDTVPFEHCFEIDRGISGRAACDAKIFVSHISYTISGGDTAEVRLVAGISVRLVKSETVRTVSAMKLESEPGSEAAERMYIMYFVQPGDTLWNIAKRYKTTVSDIVAANNITNPDRISVGQKIRLSVN